ncbi:discoidin domain-containing protein [Streptomyces decoyicus]|uniref:discoidin domain-containing protein n=1 Tax=Streptomyces decoyicus TaxID=249567 RepID=UPI002E357822|nr:discoidin domain-containing protein [Streptomyces decoyicus]
MYLTATQAGSLLQAVGESVPVQFSISTATETKKGTLFLTFRKPGSGPDVRCRALTITLPVGPNRTDLVAATDAANADDIDDYPRDSAGVEWTIERKTTPPEPTSPSEVTALTFTCTPDTPSADTTFGAGREFTLILSSIPINRAEGPARLTLTETTATGTGEVPARTFSTTMTANPSYPLSNLAGDGSSEFRTQGTPALNSTLTLDLGSIQPVTGYYLLTGTAGGGNRSGTPVLESSTTGATNSWQRRTFNSSQSVNNHTLTTPVEARYLRLRLSTTPTGFFGMRHFSVSTTATWADRPIALPSVEKAGNEFFFRGFSCQKPRVAQGTATVLQWEGTPRNTEYYLSWDDHAPKKLNPPQVSGLHTEPTHELTRTTTFVLNAQTKNAANETVHHYLSTTVTVNGPDITAKTLDVTDKLEVDATFAANGRTKKTTANTTTFDGSVTLN